MQEQTYSNLFTHDTIGWQELPPERAYNIRQALARQSGSPFPAIRETVHFLPAFSTETILLLRVSCHGGRFWSKPSENTVRHHTMIENGVAYLIALHYGDNEPSFVNLPNREETLPVLVEMLGIGIDKSNWRQYLALWQLFTDSFFENDAPSLLLSTDLLEENQIDEEIVSAVSNYGDYDDHGLIRHNTQAGIFEKQTKDNVAIEASIPAFYLSLLVVVDVQIFDNGVVEARVRELPKSYRVVGFTRQVHLWPISVSNQAQAHFDDLQKRMYASINIWKTFSGAALI